MDYQQATIRTATSLRSIATDPDLRQVSHLSLPEVEAAADLVAQLVPAGNVPGVILTGLARLAGPKVPAETVRRDIGLLFKGVEQTLDRALYAAVFAGPGAILWGYQALLKLAGKSPEAAFPEGVWQFYVEYALRDDTARHANETHGFDTALRQHHIHLSPADRLAAWVLTAIHILYQYDDLLANEWRERTACRLLSEAANRAGVYRAWQKQIPYRRGPDAAGQSYAQYRRACFDEFVRSVTAGLPGAVSQAYLQQFHRLESDELRTYQRQMTALAYLQPDAHNEKRFRYPVSQAHIGVISLGWYYLVPAAQPGANQPLDVASVRGLAAAILEDHPDGLPNALLPLARTRRGSLAAIRSRLSAPLTHELNSLRLAPVLLNTDRPQMNGIQPYQPSLSEIRQSERGLGDHPLTIFDAGNTFVFDQSHIFFDGAWGAALAEIMTNEAIAWAAYLAQLPPVSALPRLPYRLGLQFLPSDTAQLRSVEMLPHEAAAETSAVDMDSLSHLRRVFKQRSDLLGLTINDILVLYRAIHATTYRPSPTLLDELESLQAVKDARQAAQMALDALSAAGQDSPALLIPIDASQRNPRERLYPFSFTAPLNELDILGLHRRTLAAMLKIDLPSGALPTGETTYSYGSSREPGSAAPGGDDFGGLQRAYLAALAGFGAVLSRAKELAGQGQSASIGAIRALAHLPPPVQHVLDQLPAALEPLNDLLKGREVFSNIGAVAPGSTLSRFHSAKDDNRQKMLVWGVMTDEKGVMNISLRDFRPHVPALAETGRMALAQRMTQEYLEASALGLNRYLEELYQIAVAGHLK